MTARLRTLIYQPFILRISKIMNSIFRGQLQAQAGWLVSFMGLIFTIPSMPMMEISMAADWLEIITLPGLVTVLHSPLTKMYWGNCPRTPALFGRMVQAYLPL